MHALTGFCLLVMLGMGAGCASEPLDDAAAPSSAAGSAGAAGNGGAGPGGGVGGASSESQGGAALYGLYCATCHGEQGMGSPKAPDIMHPIRDYSSWVVRNGRAQTSYPKPMDAWTTELLPDEQLTSIFDYLDTPAQPTSGKALFGDYCDNCHGADGKGGPTMRDVTTSKIRLEGQVRLGTHPGEFDMRREFMPAFPVSVLSDAELQLISDYVTTL